MRQLVRLRTRSIRLRRWLGRIQSFSRKRCACGFLYIFSPTNMSIQRQTDIANGIFLSIAALFLLLITVPVTRIGSTVYLVLTSSAYGGAVYRGGLQQKHFSRRSKNAYSKLISNIIYFGLVLALFGYMTTTGVALLTTESKSSKT